VIAYYVHHHGSGHAHRAAAIAAHLSSPVVGLGSGQAPAEWPGRWVRLPDDADGVTEGAADDVTAGRTLHWAPRRHRALRERMQLISRALTDVALLVVDVSVEVALLGRLHGVPVVVMAQPGDRTDRPHRLAYDLAERLLAPWPARRCQDWPTEWVAKTVHLGAVSRFDGRPMRRPDAARRVLAFWGSGGLDVGADEMRAAAAATPDWKWDVVGPPADAGGPANLTWRGWVDDVWPELGAASVIVTHAGQNALAEVAAARRPAVVVPQRRPHAEQLATGDALRRAGLGVVTSAWPAPAAWPGVLEQAAAQGGGAWQHWSPGDGAARAAALLDGLAR
jgi:hypothetical protein